MKSACGLTKSAAVQFADATEFAEQETADGSVGELPHAVKASEAASKVQRRMVRDMR